MTVAELDREIQAEEALAQELAKYPGEWVAVRDHAIVAHRGTLTELREQIEKAALEVEGVFRVPEADTSSCFF